MENNERTTEIYEQIEVYPKPPVLPLPDLDDVKAFETAGIRTTPLSRRLSRFLISAIGIKGAYPRIALGLEDTLRRTNLRLPGLYSPIVSATILLADDPRIQDPYQRAATLLAGAHSLCDDLFTGRLPPDDYRGEPLEMGQYPNLFSTCLVIENRQVRMFKSTHFDQVMVALGGRFYQLGTGQPGEPAPVGQVIQALKSLAEAHGGDGLGPGEPAPGILTCASNRTQFQAFAQMERDPQNRTSLERLRHSFLTLCLDLDHRPASDAEALQLAHTGNCANRWFHSSLQVVVFGNGKACLVCSFTCYLDGNTMMRGAAEIQQRAAACPLPEAAVEGSPALPAPVRLEWIIPPQLFQQAKRDLELALDPQPASFEIQGFGRSVWSQSDLPAVPVFILALELAAHRILGQTPTVTQFLVMSRYRCMDMTSANITTPEVRQCIEYLQGDHPQPAEATRLIRLAIESQERTARQARSSLNLNMLLNLYIHSLQGLRRRFSGYLYVAVMILMTLLGYLKGMDREILVSHPEIYPQAPLVGRPGIRLLYVKHFGLHYQIHEDKIVVVFMPSPRWKTTNQALCDAITRSLGEIQALVETSKG